VGGKMGNRSIYLKQRTATKWKDLMDHAEIYEIKLPKATSIRKYKGDQDTWGTGKIPQRQYYGWTKDRVLLLKVSACWTNLRGSIKIILAGKGYSAVFSRDDNVDGYPSIDIPRDYNNPRNCDVFPNIRVGTWLVCGEKYNGNTDELQLYIVSNESDVKDVKRILETAWKLRKLYTDNRGYKWDEEYQLKSHGTVSLMEMLRQKVIFDLALRRFRWLERRDKWDLWNAVKANISMKDNGTTFVIKMKALDGNNWYFETDSKTKMDNEQFGGMNYDKSIFSIDWWMPFVYREPGETFLTWNSTQRRYELMNLFLQAPFRIPLQRLVLGFNRRRVTITRKKTGNNAILNYLDGKVVKSSNMIDKIRDYFINGKPIVPRKKMKINPKGIKKPKGQILSREAQTLIENGLDGSMNDLEGEFPFHLNIIYKEDERRWYIECAGKLYHVKGGYGALKKVETAIKGRAIIDREKYGWEYGSRSGTGLIRERIATLVGHKESLEIILNVKQMGALMRVMKGA